MTFNLRRSHTCVKGGKGARGAWLDRWDDEVPAPNNNASPVELRGGASGSGDVMF